MDTSQSMTELTATQKLERRLRGQTHRVAILKQKETNRMQREQIKNEQTERGIQELKRLRAYNAWQEDKKKHAEEVNRANIQAIVRETIVQDQTQAQIQAQVQEMNRQLALQQLTIQQLTAQLQQMAVEHQYLIHQLSVQFQPAGSSLTAE